MSAYVVRFIAPSDGSFLEVQVDARGFDEASRCAVDTLQAAGRLSEFNSRPDPVQIRRVVS